MYSANTKNEHRSLYLVFLAWIVYTTAYLGKVNYSANITQIVDFYNVTKAEAGLVPTFFFFTYGIGQFINGFLCKRYNIKWMVFTSLALSGLINLTVALATDFSLVKWLWMANGFLLSVLWPTLIRLISETLPRRHLGKSSVIMGTTVASGTLIIYALSSVYAAFGNFKLAFYTAAVAAIVVSVIWLLAYNRVVSISKKDKDESACSTAHEKQTDNGASRHSVISIICVLCFCAIGVNLLKDGVVTWVPSILKEEGSLPDSLSILLTLFLPIISIPGNVVALKVHKKIPNYIAHYLVMFIAIAVIIGITIVILPYKIIWAMLACLVIVKLLSGSMNNLITSIFPMFMRDKVDSGKVAGILNGFCYLGSTLSSYGLGAIADSFGWGAVFWCLMGVCILMAFVCLLHIILSSIHKQKI